jgi:hypothetical protein
MLQCFVNVHRIPGIVNGCVNAGVVVRSGLYDAEDNPARTPARTDARKALLFRAVN